MKSPTDSGAWKNNYISHDADWLDYDATVSTAPDQIAITSGYLQREWMENGRRYFHYKMDAPILDLWAFQSARYATATDKWTSPDGKVVDIAVYYHPTHTWNVPRIQKLAPPKPQVIGGQTTGVDSRFPEMKPGDVFGHFAAINPLTGEKKWEIPLTDLPSSAGMLVTGGGLVFTGKLTGEFVALDEETGKTLWQFKTGSSVNSTAITYTYKGRQYLTIASGLGGSLATRYAAAKMPAGGSVWTFALMPE